MEEKMQNNTQQQIQEVKTTYADPTPLGLLGLAMVTLVASTQKLDITEGLSFVLPWAIFLGAGAQLYASYGDYKRNNSFGATAFAGYGFFWLAVAMSWFIKMGVFGTKLAEAVDVRQLGYAFLGYLLFTVIMTIGALKTTKALFMVFFEINFLFLGLGLSSLGIAAEAMHKLAAWSELIISLNTFYCLAGAVLNPMFGKQVVPLGKAIK
jgi:succinate-acetate transporter protein